eukprot:gene22280-biopygen8740
MTMLTRELVLGGVEVEECTTSARIAAAIANQSQGTAGLGPRGRAGPWTWRANKMWWCETEGQTYQGRQTARANVKGLPVVSCGGCGVVWRGAVRCDMLQCVGLGVVWCAVWCCVVLCGAVWCCAEVMKCEGI